MVRKNKMRLKFITQCDECGNKGKAVLHFWNVEDNLWQPVESIECKVWEYKTVIKER